MESVWEVNREATVSVREKARSKNDEWARSTGSAPTDRREPPGFTGELFASPAEYLPCAGRHRVTRGPVKAEEWDLGQTMVVNKTFKTRGMVAGEKEVVGEVDALVHIETQCGLRNRNPFVPKLWTWNDDRKKGKVFITSQSVGSETLQRIVEKDRSAVEDSELLEDETLESVTLTSETLNSDTLDSESVDSDSTHSESIHSETLYSETSDDSAGEVEIPTWEVVQLESIFYQVCRKVEFMHSIGVYHLDIHPSNIVLGRTQHEIDTGKKPYKEQEVFIVDFGSSRLAEGAKSQGDTKYTAKPGDEIVERPRQGRPSTRDHQQDFVTSHFFPNAKRNVNGKLADRYQLGVLAVHMFGGSDLRSLPSTISKDLGNMIRAMTSADPTHRLAPEAKLDDFPFMKRLQAGIDGGERLGGNRTETALPTLRSDTATETVHKAVQALGPKLSCPAALLQYIERLLVEDYKRNQVGVATAAGLGRQEAMAAAGVASVESTDGGEDEGGDAGTYKAEGQGKGKEKGNSREQQPEGIGSSSGCGGESSDESPSMATSKGTSAAPDDPAQGRLGEAVNQMGADGNSSADQGESETIGQRVKRRLQVVRRTNGERSGGMSVGGGRGGDTAVSKRQGGGTKARGGRAGRVLPQATRAEPVKRARGARGGTQGSSAGRQEGEGRVTREGQGMPAAKGKQARAAAAGRSGGSRPGPGGATAARGKRGRRGDDDAEDVGVGSPAKKSKDEHGNAQSSSRGQEAAAGGEARKEPAANDEGRNGNKSEGVWAARLRHRRGGGGGGGGGGSGGSGSTAVAGTSPPSC